MGLLGYALASAAQASVEKQASTAAAIGKVCDTVVIQMLLVVHCW
jgi:hypothetical protein